MKVSEDVQSLLKEIVDHFDNEDRSVRERQVRTWRRLKLFWEGFHRTWYSEVAHDWRIWDESASQGDDTQQAYYDRPVNIFRAYLESIIAALSVLIPPIKCYPDDADNTLDLQTAKAGDRISKLLYRHNDAQLLWIHALFIFCTEGMTACYSYAKSDDSYGTYQKKSYEDSEEEHQIARCPSCGYNIADTVTNPQTAALDNKLSQDKDKFQPTDEDVPVQDYINEHGDELCPSCGQQIIPILVKETFTVTKLVGITTEPKSRICMEAYGGLNVKVPNWARCQKDIPYLMWMYETHYANAIEQFEDLDADELRSKIRGSQGPKTDLNEEWARLSPQYNGEYPTSVVTVKSVWLRPASYNILDDDESKQLRKQFPNGCKVVYVNDCFAQACNESLDDCWTITYNPLSDYIHFDPLGLLLVSVQELVNDLISLTTQTIEHGIGQTFVDPETLDFDAYRQLESVPGGVYEAKPKSGKNLGDSFYEVKTANLSGEVLPFFQQLQSLGQMVSGALPSLFGGAVQGGGTASEYSMSRAQALQRLQNSWKLFTLWWKNVFGKAIPAYITEVKEDEKYVERSRDGSFINVFIRKAELEGKIGRVELEANENLPITWSQKRDTIMQLIQTGVPEILQVLGSPENLPVIKEAIGLDDFFVPGTDDIEKQFDEIKQLLDSAPMQSPPQMNPQTGQMMPGPEMPSVEVDPDYDNHQVEFEICKKWITSEAGRQAKNDPKMQDGYKNVLLHGKMHLQLIQQAQQQQTQQQIQNAVLEHEMKHNISSPQGTGPRSAKPKQDTRAPIKGENNVPSVQ